MKHVFVVLFGWGLWILLWFVIFNPLIESDRIKTMENRINGNYTSKDMIMPKMSNIYEVRNLSITFLNGDYEVSYKLYAKCTEYYPNSYTCADNEEQFLNDVYGSGTYTIEDNYLILNITNGDTRKCELEKKYNDYYDIDCTSYGGWLYKRIDN